MPNEQSGKSTLGSLRLQYLGGDDDWYSGTSATILSPITVSGAFASILKFADENSLSIVPEAQNMTKYDGNGVATVTLSPERMDVNTTTGGGGTEVTPIGGTIRIYNGGASAYTQRVCYITYYDYAMADSYQFNIDASRNGYIEKSSLQPGQVIYVPSTTLNSADSSGVTQVDTELYRLDSDGFVLDLEVNA